MKHFAIVFSMMTVLTGCNSAPPQVLDQFVHCRSLDGERTAVKILEWKFDAVRNELSAVCEAGVSMPSQEITRRTLRKISPELRDSLGEPEKCIELTLRELEVRGVFVRSETANSGKSGLELARVSSRHTT